MLKLVFATNNVNKVTEVRAALVETAIEIVSLQEAGISVEIPEPFSTLEENAAHKARTVVEMLNNAPGCFSEDTGLEVDVLDGAPGVHSARYAGEDRSPSANMSKLLRELRGSADRTAQFRTVIALVIDNDLVLFEGICRGRILESPRGLQGFGYDPLFVPDGADHTFAEMTLVEKNSYSHRRKAVDQLVTFLKDHYKEG